MPNNTENFPNITMGKITLMVLILLIAVISFTKVSNWAADPNTHRHSIEQTDEKVKDVMTLSAGAAAASATLSLLPGDMCTPLSEQCAELATYFLLILSALYLEKFMITLSGYVTFRVLIPLACLFVIAGILLGKKTLYSIAARIALIGAVIYLIVPASILLSDKIYQTQAEKVDSAITQYNELDVGEDTDQGLIGELTTLTTNTVDKMTAFITSLLESLAVMIVTACVVPLLVFVFLVWIAKTIFLTDRSNS